MIQSQIVILGGTDNKLTSQQRATLNEFDVEASNLANKAKELKRKLCV